MLAHSRARPGPLRFLAYLQERLPPLSTCVFVGLFFASAALVAVRLGEGTRVGWAGAVVVLLVFFRLRVADEHKDWETDRVEHPERLLSRGVVTLAELATAGRVAFAVELAIVLALGLRATVAWAGVSVFALLMRWEFGLGGWLRRHVVAYALTHNPITALLAMFALACTDARANPAFLLYVGLAAVAALAYELGRKAASYSAALGRLRARALLLGCYGVGALLLSAVLVALRNPVLSGPWPHVAATVPPLAALALISRSEGASASVFLITSFTVALVAAI